MFKTYEEIEKYFTDNKIKKRIAVAGAQDDLALPAIVRAKNKGFITPILVGDEIKISELLAGLGEDAKDYEIINEPRESRCAVLAVTMVKEGKADIPMKGLMQTSSFLMALGNPISGLVQENSIVNEVTVFEYPNQGRMIVLGDCAVSIAPTLEQKKKITDNLIKVARAYHAKEILVAAMSVLEKPNPDIPSTVEARELANMDWGEDVIVEGPLALDNVLDLEAAKHKGIDSKVAGKANVLLVPDIHAGNFLHKAIHYFGHYKFSSGLVGADTPVIMNSRTDDMDAKYYSILSAILQSV